MPKIILKKSKQKAVGTKLWFKVTMATVPDSAAVLSTGMCTAVVDTGLKGLTNRF